MLERLGRGQKKLDEVGFLKIPRKKKKPFEL